MTFQIFIKEKKTYTFNVEPLTTIKEIRKIILDVLKIPENFYFLSTGHKILSDPDKSLVDYNIKPETTISICIRSGN